MSNAGRPRRAAGEWALWLAALVAVTVAMLAARGTLDKAHVALGYLLIVLGGSARGGRALGLTLAVLSFLCFNFFFLPPYHTLAIAHPLDWLVLVVFLVTSVVAAQLLYRAQAQTLAAEARASEIDRLASLGAETLNVARAEDALAAVAEVIRTTLGAARCDVYVAGEDGGPPTQAAGTAADPVAPDAVRGAGRGDLVEWVAIHGRIAVERPDGTSGVAPAGAPAAADIAAELEQLAPLGARTLVLPLRVRERTVGVLRVAGGAPLALDAARRRVAGALAYYAALGAERVRLAARAEHAEALREADRLKDALLAAVSHDLRTPLTTIKALAHELGASGDERAAVIEQEADRLNRMVADLLDLSRLNGGALPLALELNDADDLLGAAAQRVSGAPGAGARLRVSGAPDDDGGAPLAGRFDLVQSIRVLVNLVENALKYAPPDSPVELSARRDGAALAFAVADRGPGVPPDERERIFEPFYRRAGAAPDAGGAGLGLAIARRLAEAQHGTLTYEPRPGGGSVFTLRVPTAEKRD